jgi:hypothetical protein
VTVVWPPLMLSARACGAVSKPNTHNVKMRRCISFSFAGLIEWNWCGKINVQAAPNRHSC